MSHKIRKIVAISTVIFMLAGISYIWITSAGWTYSEGSRAGTITKFSYKGSWIKTWEGELAMGSIEQGGQREKWEFSVNEDEDGKGIVKQVEDALDSGRRVKVYYRQQRSAQSWKGATTYFVTKVEYLGE